MIRLNQTASQLLSLITAQNGATCVVSYSDKSATGYDGNTQVTAIASATTTTICSTPAASTIRDIDHISIKNTYAGSHSITVQLSSSATLYPLVAVTLANGDSLEYTHGSGWQVTDANGNKKVTPFSGMTSAQLASLISDETGSGLLVFATSPTLTTPKATSTIGVGNATPSASGAGISFPATQSASTDANTLDDYEEGTWTATITSGATGSPTSTGKYTKIGRLVTIELSTGFVSAALDGNALIISGLPFAVGNSPIFAPSGAIMRCAFTATSKSYWYTAASGTTLSLKEIPALSATESAVVTQAGTYSPVMAAHITYSV